MVCLIRRLVITIANEILYCPGLFDLETRREKHLELLEREARLKERNKKTIKFIPKLIRTLGMKRFSEQVMVMMMIITMMPDHYDIHDYHY